jgi:hypothetical protein
VAAWACNAHYRRTDPRNNGAGTARGPTQSRGERPLRGGPSASGHVWEVFRYAIATGRADRDPSADLRGALTAPQVTHRAAITDPAEIGALLRAIEGYSGQFGTKLALKLLALTFVRPGKIRHGEWSEFDLEVAE